MTAFTKESSGEKQGIARQKRHGHQSSFNENDQKQYNIYRGAVFIEEPWEVQSK